MNWWLLLLVAACRVADLGTTFLVTPTLRWERNPLIKLLGWKGTVLLNVAVCGVSPYFPTFLFVLAGFSVLAALWNFRILMRLKNMG